MEFDYTPVSEQLKEKEEENARIKEYLDTHSILDEELFKSDHAYNESEVELLLSRALPINIDKNNAKMVSSFERVFKDYIDSHNSKMIERMVAIFNQYARPFSAEINSDKTLFHKFEFIYKSAENDRHCRIDFSKLPKKISMAILERAKELRTNKVSKKLKLINAFKSKEEKDLLF